MKFTCQVEINAPIEKVFSLFIDKDNLKEWQDGFVSCEHLEGAPNTVGAKYFLKYDNGKHKIDITETITEMSAPNKYYGLYEHKHMVNTMYNSFSASSENSTQYTVDIEYLEFIGLIPKLMAYLFPSVFKKQTQKWVDQFKQFVEKQ